MSPCSLAYAPLNHPTQVPPSFVMVRGDPHWTNAPSPSVPQPSNSNGPALMPLTRGSSKSISHVIVASRTRLVPLGSGPGIRRLPGMHVSVPCTSTASPHRTGDGSGVAGAGVTACGADRAVAGGGLADGDANPAVGSGATVVVEPDAQPASPTTAATAEREHVGRGVRVHVQSPSGRSMRAVADPAPPLRCPASSVAWAGRASGSRAVRLLACYGEPRARSRDIRPSRRGPRGGVVRTRRGHPGCDRGVAEERLLVVTLPWRSRATLPSGIDADVSARRSVGTGLLNRLAISQTAMTISCTASGPMRMPSESPNMLPSGAAM